MRHLKLIKFYERPIELRQFTGQTVNLPRMKIDLMKKKPPTETKQQKKTAQKKLILEMTTQNEARIKKMSKSVFCWHFIVNSLVRQLNEDGNHMHIHSDHREN